MSIINNILYVCEENYINNDIIGIADSTDKAKEIISEYHKKLFDINTSELKWIGQNGVYSCYVVNKDTKDILVRNFAEINPIELNERLF